jgi:spore coat protein SA
MKNICIVVGGILPIPDVRGGAIERLVTMIASLHELQPDFSLTIITHHNEEAMKEQIKFKNCRFINLTTWGKGYYEAMWKVRGLCRKLGITNHFRLHVYERKVERYLMKHGGEYDLIVNEGLQFEVMQKPSEKWGKERFCAHLHCNLIASPLTEKTYGAIIGVSDYITNQYIYSSALPAGRAKTVFNGIDVNNFNLHITEDEKTSMRNRLGIAKDDFVIVYCGRIVPQKGVKELIQSVLSIPNPEVKLIIVGSSDFALGNKGAYSEEINRLVQQNKDKIRFTGYVNNNEVYKYHKLADVGVVPSIYNDPCPLALFEMIASGISTISTLMGGIPEIGNSQTTRFVPVENVVDNLKAVILDLYHHPDLRREMALAAQKRIPYLSKERFYKDFVETILNF